MTRLQWTQVAPPDYINAIYGLGSAGKAFNEGMQGISAAIGANKERQGQQISNDILLDMANIYREDQIPDFVNNIRAKYGDKLNYLSPEVQKYLADPRQIIIQNEQRRAYAEGTKLNNLDKSNDIQYIQGQRQQNAAANALLAQAKIAQENGDAVKAQNYIDAANKTTTYGLGGVSKPSINNVSGNDSNGESANNGITITSSDGEQFNISPNRQNAEELTKVFKDSSIEKYINDAASNPNPGNDAMQAEAIAKQGGYTQSSIVDAINQMIKRKRQRLAERAGDSNSYLGENANLFSNNANKPQSNELQTNDFVQNIINAGGSTPVIGTTQAQIDPNLQQNPQVNTVTSLLGGNIPQQETIPSNVVNTPNNAAIVSNNPQVNAVNSALGNNSAVVANPNQNIATGDTPPNIVSKPETTEVGVKNTENYADLAKNNPAALSQTVEDQKSEADAVFGTNSFGNFYDAYKANKAGENQYKAKVNDVATILRNQADSDGKTLSQEDAMGFIDGTINSYVNEIQKNLEADDNFKGKVDKGFIKNYLLQTIEPESWFRARGMLPNGKFSNLKESGEIVDNLKSFFNSGGVKSLVKSERLIENRKYAEDTYYPKFKEAEARYIALSANPPLSENGIQAYNKSLALAQRDMYKYGKAYSDAINDYSKGISTQSGINNNSQSTGEVRSNNDTNDNRSKELNSQITEAIPAGTPNANRIRNQVITETKDLNDALSAFDKILSPRRQAVIKSLDQDVLNKLPENERNNLINDALYNNDDIKQNGIIFNTSREQAGNKLKRNIMNALSIDDINTGMPIDSIALQNPIVKAFYNDIVKMSGKEIMSNAPQLQNKLNAIIDDVSGRTKSAQSRLNNN